MSRSKQLPWRWFTTTSRLALTGAVLAFAPDASAYAWMIRHHYTACATCHVDPSGGEALTPYGRAQGELLLRTQYGSEAAAPPEPPAGAAAVDSFDSFDSFDAAPSGPAPVEDSRAAAAPVAAPAADAALADPTRRGDFLWGVPTADWLSLGGSLRMASLLRPQSGNGGARVFPMQADLYGALLLGSFRAGGSVGISRVPASSPHARPAQITTGQGEQLNLISRTHYLGLALGEEWLVRAGRLNLPFGLRVPEHVLWVRTATQTDRETAQQHGVAVSYTGKRLRGEVMAIAGNYQVNPDRYRERGYSLFGELNLEDGLALGASSLVTRAESDLVQDVDAPTWRQAHGLFTRWVPQQRLALLAEADLLLRTDRELGYVGLIQLDLEALSGLHAIGSLELLDDGYRPDPLWFEQRRRPGNGQPRLGGGLALQWFFYSHLDLRLDVHYGEPPTHEQRNGALDVLAQLHVFL